MTAIQTRPAPFNTNYAPAARYQAPNNFAPVGHRRPVAQSAPAWGQQAPRPQHFPTVPYTPLQGAGAAYLERPRLQTSIPMPVVTLLATIVIIIAIAIGYWAAA